MHAYMDSKVIWKRSVSCEEDLVRDDGMLDMEEMSSVLG